MKSYSLTDRSAFIITNIIIINRVFIMMLNMLCVVSDLHALFHLILTISPNTTNGKKKTEA